MPMSPRLLRPRASGDPDANRYLSAVQTADGQVLEAAVRKAVNDFVVGCKADGIWSAIKASCILMGARTLSGALTPLVGSAPTNNNFVSGDYNRKTGLIGNGSTKYLNSNRAANADGQNDMHIAVYQSAAPSSTTAFSSHFGAREASPSARSVQLVDGYGTGGLNIKVFRCRDDGVVVWPTRNATNTANGLQAMRRNSSSSFTWRAGATDTSANTTSLAMGATTYFVFAQNEDGTPANHSNGRYAFYSIGSSLTLATLDSRVTTLYNAIGAAIP